MVPAAEVVQVAEVLAQVPNVTDITVDTTEFDTSSLDLAAPVAPKGDGLPTPKVDEQTAALKAYAYSEVAEPDATSTQKDETSERIKNNLMLYGTDLEVNEFEEQATRSRQRLLGESLVQDVVGARFGPERAVESLSGALRAGTVSVEEEMLLRDAENADKEPSLLLDEDNGFEILTYSDIVNEQQARSQAIRDALNPIAAQLDPSFRSYLADFGESVVPFAYSAFAGRLMAELENIEGGSRMDRFLAGMKGFFLPGETVNRAGEMIKQIPRDELPEFTRQLATAVRDKSGIGLGPNDVETWELLSRIIRAGDNDLSGIDWERGLLDTITVIDAIPFVSKAGRKAVDFFARSSRVNRKRAAGYLKDAFKDPSSTKGLVLPIEDLANMQLPKTTLRDIQSNPSIVADSMEVTLPRVAAAVRATDNTAITFTEREVTAVTERLETAYNSTRGGYMFPDKFVIDASAGDRVAVESFIGRTKNGAGWKDLRAVLRNAELRTDGDLTGVRVLVRNTEGGFDPFVTGQELRKMSKGKLPISGDEYFIQIKNTHFMSELDKMAFGGNPTIFSGPLGKGRGLMEPTGQFSEEVWKPSFVAVGREQEFLKEGIALANDYWRLPRGGRNRVARLLREGASEKKLYSPEELVALDPKLTVRDIKGYYSMRSANDASWAVANNLAYKEAQARGFRTLSTDKATYITRPLRPHDDTPVRAFDPRTRKVVDVSESSLEGIRKAGGDIEVLRKGDAISRKLSDNVESTVYIIRRNEELSPLPINLLKYEDGYLTRIYKDNFFVVRNEPVVANGVKSMNFSTVHTARTQGEATKIAEELTQSTGISHTFKDTVVDDSFSKIIDDVMRIEEDRIVFGRRTEKPLTRPDGTDAPLVDPVEATHRAVAAVSRSVGVEDLVRKQEKAFFKTYSDLDVLSPKLVMEYQANRFGPEAITKALKQAPAAQRERALQALQQWEYYRMLRGMSDSNAMKGYRAMIRSLSNKVETLTHSPSVGQAINALSYFDPVTTAKGLTFTTLISANPFRQFFLQTSQFAFISAINPVLATKAVSHAPIVRLGLNTIDTKNWPIWKTSMAKGLRISEDEVETMVRQFKESGLVAEIDSYAYIGAQLTEPSYKYHQGMLGQTGQMIGNAVKAPLNIAKKVGFDWGEMNNLSMTWMFALKNYLKKNGKQIRDLSPREWQEIASQSSAWALSMHKGGSFSYQQGLMSALTQFWSITHKALSAMWPARLGGNASFTGSQKASIAAFQISMWGATGLGAEAIIRDMMVANKTLEGVPEEQARGIIRIISTGLGEMLLNHILSDDPDNPIDLAYGESYAPASAGVSNVTDFMLSLIHMNSVDAIVDATALGSTLGRYTDMARYIRYTLAMEDTLPNSPSKLERIMRVSPTVFSGYNNAMKAFYAMRTGQYVTQYGDHSTHVMYREAVLRGLMGIETNAEVDIRRLYNIDGKGFQFSEGHATEIAKNIHRAMSRNLLIYEKDGKFDYNRYSRDVEGERVILEILKDTEKEQVRLEFMKLVEQARGRPEDIFMRLFSITEQGAVTPDKMKEEIRTNMFADKYAEQRDALLYLLDQMIEGREDRIEFLKEQNMEFNEDDFSFYLQEAQE